MKVSELIELLEDFDPEAEVGFGYNYGDYWRTIVVAEPTEVDTREVEYSDYHRMLKLAEPENTEDWNEEDWENWENAEPNPNIRTLVVLQ